MEASSAAMGFFEKLGGLQDSVFAPYMWVLILGFIIAFFLAFSVGANDVANPFGTSVGSGALTLLQVCIAATFMETLGALTLGGAVSDTIRKKIVNPDLYNETIPQFMVGQACAMLGAASWQILASVLKMPVSGTHSIVGAVLGFALVSRKGQGIFWWTIFKIVLSWFISPILAGITAVVLYVGLKFLILSRENKTERALVLLPFFYALVIFLNVFSVLFTGSKIYQLEVLKTWHMLLISLGAATVVLIAFWIFITPKQREHIKKMREEAGYHAVGKLTAVDQAVITPRSPNKTLSFVFFLNFAKEKEEKEGLEYSAGIPMTADKRNESSGSLSSLVSKISNISTGSKTSIYGVVRKTDDKLCGTEEEDDSLNDGSEGEEMRYMFSHLQAFSACLDAFAHGGNDVGNSIGPVLALWSAFSAGNLLFGKDPFIIAYGCFGIIIGLWVLGRRVIETVGEDIAEITPARGFSIDIMAGLTVLLGSNFGIPLSTTHCKVGAVVAVSLIHNRNAVSWRTFGNIAWAWIVTLPVSGAISAFFYWLIIKFL
ncbi:unnamed protein product [Oikopleura dioica]|uniref:Phosphate transporter n=1 Tax=Oikopleura dioica TaxID=34765 RepID=E4Y8K7_OIKDI|nr:unnamed protein product [Oikopleura dioica]